MQVIGAAIKGRSIKSVHRKNWITVVPFYLAATDLPHDQSVRNS